MEKLKPADVPENLSHLHHYWEISKGLEDKLFKITLKLLPNALLARAFGFTVSKSLSIKWYLDDRREIAKLRQIKKASSRDNF